MAACRGPVSSICLATELNAVIVGDTSGGVSVFDVESGAKLREFDREKAEAVTAVAYAPGLRAVIAAECSMARDTARVLIWDADSGALRTEMTYTNYVCSLAFASELQAVVSGDGNFMTDKQTGQVVVWNIHTLEKHLKLRCAAAVTSVAYAPQQRAIIAADRSKTVTIWDADSGTRRLELRCTELPWGLALAPEVEAFVVSECHFGGAGRKQMPEQQFGRVAICDVASGERRAEFDCSSPVMSLAFVPDNGVVVCGARDGQITIWDLEAQRKRSTLSMPSSVNSLVYDLITKRLTAGDKSGNIRVWTLDEVMSC